MDDNSLITEKHRTHQFAVLNTTKDPYKKIKLLLTAFISLVVLSYWYYQQNEFSSNTEQYLANPKIDDIYYLDFRLFSDKLRPKEKFRFAKIVDITGNVITLLYSDFFYPNEKAMINSIHYGHFRYNKYFSTYRNNFTLQQISKLRETQAIFKVERPIYDKLYGNFIKPQQAKLISTTFIEGKRENIVGESYFKASNINNHLQLAFKNFKKSAQLNYPLGQINLAQMYLMTTLEQQDFSQALYWLKQAALQSNKSAINKYTIVCQQVTNCDINDFYQDLISAGVNIRFNKTSLPKFSLN
jgi:hypothetical protein